MSKSKKKKNKRKEKIFYNIEATFFTSKSIEFIEEIRQIINNDTNNNKQIDNKGVS